MKTVLIIGLFVAFVSAKPPPTKGPALPTKGPTTPTKEHPTIVHYQFNNNGLGAYSFSYETSDGSGRTETAAPLDPKDPDSPLIIKGNYHYLGTDGKIHTVNYMADQFGYHVLDPKKSYQF